MPKFFLPIALMLAFPLAVASQTMQLTCSTGLGNFGAQSPAVKRTGVGGPYSLTASIRSELTLANANTINAFSTSRQARDSQGRIRIDEPSFCATDKEGQTHWQGSITITDPVAKTYTFWQGNMLPSTKIVTVTHEPLIKVSAPPTAQMEYDAALQLSRSFERAGNRSEQVTVKDLGKRDIAGLEARGMQITRIIPTGQQGNSLPLTYVEEKWICDKYGIILLDIQDDPIFGKSTYEVTSFTAAEPDPALFQPPSDYKINERTVAQ